MTLNITSNEIQVKNAQGNIKFTSNNKLVYLKHQKIGTRSFNGFSLNYYIPFYELKPKDFVVLYIKFNACTGNGVPASLIGNWIPANGSIIINFRGYAAGASGQPASETEILGVTATNNSSIDICQYMTGPNGMTRGNQTGNFDYDARVYSYL